MSRREVVTVTVVGREGNLLAEFLWHKAAPLTELLEHVYPKPEHGACADWGDDCGIYDLVKDAWLREPRGHEAWGGSGIDDVEDDLVKIIDTSSRRAEEARERLREWKDGKR